MYARPGRHEAITTQPDVMRKGRNQRTYRGFARDCAPRAPTAISCECSPNDFAGWEGARRARSRAGQERTSRPSPVSNTRGESDQQGYRTLPPPASSQRHRGVLR